MAKEIMIVTPEDMKNLVPSDKAMDAYRFALANAGIEMDEETAADFVVRRNLKTEGFRELAEVGKWMEKTAASIKEALKHTYNVGTEEESQSLIDSGLTTKEQLFDAVTVTAMQKAAGITTDKMLELFHEGIVINPKERTLTVK